MKIAVSSYSFSKYMQQTGCDLLKVCELAKELGYDGIEFTDLPGATQVEKLELADKIRKHCANLDLPIVGYMVGANLLSEDIDGEVKRVKECIDVCEALGANLMRHDVVYALKEKPFYTYKSAIEEIVPHIRALADYAKAKGIRTCTENHGFIFQAPERVEELILAVGHENYGWLCDIGNFLCVDAEPARSVAIAAPYTVHAHAKDFLYKTTGKKPDGFFVTTNGNYLRGTVIGHGVVPVEKCISLLKKFGYDGWLSLEFEGMEDNLDALKMGLGLLKSLV